MSLLSHFLEFRINSSGALNVLLYPSFPSTELQDYSQHHQPLETEVGLSPIPALTRREVLQSPLALTLPWISGGQTQVIRMVCALTICWSYQVNGLLPLAGAVL